MENFSLKTTKFCMFFGQLFLVLCLCQKQLSVVILKRSNLPMLIRKKSPFFQFLTFIILLFKCNHIFQGEQVTGKHENILKNVELINGESGSEIINLVVDDEYESAVPLGNYVIEWRR